MNEDTKEFRVRIMGKVIGLARLCIDLEGKAARSDPPVIYYPVDPSQLLQVHNTHFGIGYGPLDDNVLTVYYRINKHTLCNHEYIQWVKSLLAIE